MPSFSRCVFGVLAGLLFALPGSAMAADSSTCTPATVDGTFAGQKLRLAVDQPPGQVRVCFRVGAVAGGAITITGPGGSAPVPATDADDAACRAPGNTAPGPHPLADGTIQGVPVYLETYQNGNQFWVCASDGTHHERLLFTTPGATTPSVTYEQDTDIVFPPPVPDRCQVAPQTCQPPPPVGGGDQFTCTLSGVTGSISPPVRAILSGTGGSGSFTFSGSVSCTGTLGGSAMANASGSVAANGTFSNVICSTGTLDGNSNISVAGKTLSAPFHVQLTAGEGHLTFTYTITGGSTGSGRGEGEVSATPSSGNCINSDVTSFAISGVFHAGATA
jgi:hypothetical protein